MSYITKIANDNTITAQQSPENGVLQTHVVNTGTAATPRAMSRSHWFAHNDILFSILQYLDGPSFKELRLVCREAEQIFSIRSWNNPCNKLFHQKFEVKMGSMLFEYRDAFHYIVPYISDKDCKNLRRVCKEASEISHMLERFLVKMKVKNLMNDEEEGKAKLDFASQYGLNFALGLYEFDVEKFQQRLLLSKVLALLLPGDTFYQKTQKIVSMEVFFSNRLEQLEQLTRLKKVLKIISNYQNIFINLKKLCNNNLSNLANYTIPDSIEFFECRKPNEDIIISDFKNLKSITIGFIHKDCAFIKIKNLPNLESITIKSLYHQRYIDISTLPKLKSINVNGEEIPFERKAEGVANWIQMMGMNLNAEIQRRPVYGNRMPLGLEYRFMF